MLSTFCIVCHDKDHFRSEVYHTQNINSYISSRIGHLKYNRQFRLNPDEQKLYSRIRFDQKNPHMMCGVCPKVNKHELTVVEDELKRNIIFLLRAVETLDDDTKKHLLYDVSRQLQGNYPKMCRELRNYIK